MEKEKFFSNVGSLPPLIYEASSSSPPSTWYSSSLAMEVPVEELNFSSEQLPNCFLNLNWENSNNQNVQFESGLSSIVSSQAASNSGEISPQSQRLGFNGASYIGGNNSTTTSCYSTPLNSPPTLNLSMMDHQIRANLPISGNSISSHPSLTPFNADPGFAERAAKFCFVNRSFGGLTGQIGLNEVEFPYKSMPRMENEKLSRVSSNQSLMAASGSRMGSEENKDSPPLKARFDTEMRSVSASASDKKFSRLSRSSTPDNAEFVNAPNESSLSEQIPGEDTGLKRSNAINGRKRKAAPKGKAKELPSSPSAKDSKIAEEDEDSNSKRHKLDEPKIEPNGNSNSAKDQKQMKDNSKPPEPPKDYIHVRARRGQATDSHSLAERVRREKISERMKLLQDLVPGCNKVTGKAVMLDEIINYVQSLQRQVEFLSMKLATVNPRLDFNMESLLSKDILQMRGGLSPHTIYPLNSSSSTFPYGRESHCFVNPLDHTLQNPNVQLPSSVHGFAEAASQVTTFWDEDLPSFIQMGFGQNQSQEPFQPQNFHDSLQTGVMKVEL